MVVMLAMTTVIVDPGYIFADQGDGGKVISAYMTYNESQYDVFNDTLRVSTDSQPIRTQTKIVYPITFKVVGGSWDDGTSADKRVDLSRYDDEDLALVLKPEDIPGVGNQPKVGYLKGGSWDVEPPLDKVISEAKTYTYTYKVDPNYNPTKKVTKPGKTKVKQAIKKKYSKKLKFTVKSKKFKKYKKLYVRARAYKLDGKKKIFGKWSKVKKVKRK